MINASCNTDGIYKAYIIDVDGDIRIYVPCISSNTNECPLDSNNNLILEIFQKNKELYPKPLWCVPNVEAKQHEQVHPCWVTFENGDIDRPIIMGFLGKGIMYSVAVNSNASNTSNNTYNGNSTAGNNNGNQTSNQTVSDVTVSNSGWAWPVPGYSLITSGYCTPKRPDHYGIDISGSNINGAAIIAIQDGTVTTKQSLTGSYGNWIAIEHSGGIYSRYAHMSNFANNINVGTVVKQGDVIGYVGSTGNSTGPHLHFEIRPNNTPANPLNYVTQP